MKDFLFYAMIYFIIGGILSSFNYFYYVFKDKNNYDIIEGPGEIELIIFLCFPLYLFSILLTYWFSFLKWLAIRFRK
jgi:hypothetical protein